MIERLIGAAWAPPQNAAPIKAAAIKVADLILIRTSHALYFSRNLLFICKASIDEILAVCQAIGFTGHRRCGGWPRCTG
jgi:hypothetical protein